MGKPVVHFEIIGSDASKLQTFYSELFDWNINADNEMHYGLVEAANGVGIGGGISGGAETGPPRVSIYVAVDDIPAHLAKAERLGGRTLMPETEIPGMVTFGMFADPDGNTIGLVKDTM